MRGLFNLFVRADLYFAGTTPAIPSADVASNFFFYDGYVTPTPATAPVFGSQGAADFGTGTSLDPGKPSGLAVGDVMLCGVYYQNTGAALTITPPTLGGATTSWVPQQVIAWNATDTISLTVYSKVADSADVAASTFGFALSGAPGSSISYILRFSGVDTTAPVNASAQRATASGNYGVLAGLTTTVDNAYIASFGTNYDHGTPPTTPFWPYIPAPGTSPIGRYYDSSIGGGATQWMGTDGYVQLVAGTVFPINTVAPVTLTAPDDFKSITIALTPAPPAVGGARFTGYVIW